jgi:hypothetical protein
MFNSWRQGIIIILIIILINVFSFIIVLPYFFFYRLDPISEADDMQLIRDLFAGGESRRMSLNSIAARIEDNRASQHSPDTFQSLQSGNHNVSVRQFQSFQAGELLSKEVMDAILQLLVNRDHQMCEAYAQVNEKKPGYVQRSESFYVKSNLSTILMREESIDSMLADPSVAFCIRKQLFVKAYRSIIPLLWETKNEWILIIIDPSSHSVHAIYPKYTADVVLASSGDERVSNSVFLRDKLFAILSASSTLHHQPPQVVDQHQPQVPSAASNVSWQFYYIYNSSGINDTLKDNINHRTPTDMDCGISRHHDSGIYTIHAMECDYYDCPIFNTITEDWNVIRMKIAHCVLNKQLII